MKKIKDILNSKNIKKDHRNTYEYQAYGNRLADELGDSRHRTLYIKLAKTEDRILLEKAREYVMGAESAVTKGKLFMWKLSELKSRLKDTLEKESAKK